ncbi:hypothetical protein [Mesorhizobium sp.]|uniref:hypothetical protein n=1 Tax=Mesorhizobium sp. TaxID=1871066 RepID=UPI000FE82B26|nr:hypothetical protein [Mesorhizobium sp.]RWA70566.1 MAG: hypothetical protein EOQ29_13380 [Mesorhizobium sp.]RWA83483.1 MAG: hypothetical protein EOQ30_13305 [Mesorhizobium sp.]
MRHAISLFVTILFFSTASASAQCSGEIERVKSQKVLHLDGGGVAVKSKLNINIDGYGKAYHLGNASAGALIHLCNAGSVYLPDGSSYSGSRDNATCTGAFMDDVRKIKAAGWNNPLVGAVRWFGILGTGSVTVGGHSVRGVVPVEQLDGSGFFVSPTSLEDPAFPANDQRRYINPLQIPAAVIPGSTNLERMGVKLGSFGVLVDTRRANAPAIPFVVGDNGPRIGEGTPALARLAAGAALKDPITRAERFSGIIDSKSALWVFFGKGQISRPFDANKAIADAADAFRQWGGDRRLRDCLANGAIPAN